MSDVTQLNLSSTYVRLRRDASVELLTVDEHFWQRLGAGELGSFHNEYLVAIHAFEGDWSGWEMHPKGDELVCLLSGEVTFVLERSGSPEAVELKESGSCLVVPKGTWHTAKVHRPSRVLFVTAGEGTEHRSS